jgi:2-polyprenyl-3-methyl-5-hydroxy-6-metoxy-1,4-benzoquinol methylase
MFMNLVHRSYEKEILDDPSVPFEEIRRNMEELDTINTWLGGHAINFMGLSQLIKSTKPGSQLHICEIGCGGGHNLLAISKWLAKKKISARLTGIDINEHCIQVASTLMKPPQAEFIVSDYRDVIFINKPHIIFSSLFCHHFNDEELIEIFHWKKNNSELGFFMNDLHRHRLAYESIRLITRAFSKSRLVKNDAPVSVTRGFRRPELTHALTALNIHDYSLQWKWAFRWLLTCNTKSKPERD